METTQHRTALADLRLNAGMSRRQLAAATGVPATTIRNAEHGSAIRRDSRAALARVLGSAVYEAVPAWPRIDAGDLPALVERRRRGWSRRVAADRIGVSVTALKRAESGAGVHPRTAKAIADAYGLAVVDIHRPPPQDADSAVAAAA